MDGPLVLSGDMPCVETCDLSSNCYKQCGNAFSEFCRCFSVTYKHSVLQGIVWEVSAKGYLDVCSSRQLSSGFHYGT